MNGTNVKGMKGVLKLVEGMIHMADHAENTCESDCCLLVYGVIKDCAYKIRRTIEQEILCEANKHSMAKKALH